MKKYLIILLVLAFSVSMMFMGIGCKEEVAEAVEEEAVEEEAVVAEESTSAFEPGIMAMEDIELIIFLVGVEGDAYATQIYKGAVDAEEILGCKVDKLWGLGGVEPVVQQYKDGIAQKPDGFVFFGVPAEDTMWELSEEANQAGIYVSYIVLDHPNIRAEYGGGFIGPELAAQGKMIAEFAIDYGDLKAGDLVAVEAPWDMVERVIRERTALETFEENGLIVEQIMKSEEARSNPETQNPIFTALIGANPDLKAIVYAGNQTLGLTPLFMETAGKNPGDIINVGFGLDELVLGAIKEGYVQGATAQHGYMEGFLGVISAAMHLMYGYAEIYYNTSSGIVTIDNVEGVEKTIQAGVGY